MPLATRDPVPVRDRKLGTLLGVFTPAILTILGVILYLRLGWVVGTVGVQGTVLIVILANGITLITALSFSAIATNARVGVDGAYYMIARSLGLEFGAADPGDRLPHSRRRVRCPSLPGRRHCAAGADPLDPRCRKV